jgi:hypothetical protein
MHVLSFVYMSFFVYTIFSLGRFSLSSKAVALLQLFGLGEVASCQFFALSKALNCLSCCLLAQLLSYGRSEWSDLCIG